MNIFSSFVAAALLCHFVACAPNANKYGIFVKRLECDSDDDVTSGRFCIFKLIRNKVGSFSIGGNLLYPVNNARLVMQTFAKSSSNRYNPLGINVNIDFCQFVSSPLTIEAGKYIITTFWPEFIEQLGHLLHPCPYVGLLEFRNLTIERLVLPDLPEYVRTGDWKVFFRFSNAQNQTLFQITAHLFVRSHSLSPSG